MHFQKIFSTSFLEKKKQLSNQLVKMKIQDFEIIKL